MLTSSFSSDPDACLSENLAGEFLSVSVRTLQGWRVHGGGPVYVKLGRAVRYRRRDLMAFQEANVKVAVVAGKEAAR